MTSAAQHVLIDRLSRSKRVLITTHVRPDGDAVGTAAAMQLGLRSKCVDSEVLLLSMLPGKYDFLARAADLKYTAVDNERMPPREWFDRFDTLLVVDTGTWSQLPGLQTIWTAWKVPTLVLDHHQTQEPWADVRCVDTTAAAAGEMAMRLLQAWDVPINGPLATALFVAIATDTGWFQFSNTRPHTYRLAAELLENGVDQDRMYQLLYQNERPERLLLQARVLRSMQLIAGGRVATMVISREDFAETGATVPDTENLVNIPLQVAQVEASAILADEPASQIIRLSLRTKGNFDASRFCEQYGGGGHARAAGAKLKAPLADAVRTVSLALESTVR